MPTGINLVYSVNTPPIQPEKWQGQIISLFGAKFRFCAIEPLANGELEAGVVVTGTVDATGTLRVAKPTAANSRILGVTVLNLQRILRWNTSLNCFNYQNGEMVSIMAEGDIVMFAEVPVDPGDPVFFRFAVDGANTRIGAINRAAGSGLELLPGCKHLDKTSAPGLVRVSINNLI